jgi:hypothetical protein
MNKALAEKPEVDVEATAEAFAECFIGANPLGVACGKNDEQFRAQIPKGLEFYRSIGTNAMKIEALTVTPLDDHHAMVKIHWQAFYVKKNGSNLTIDFEVIYLVQILNDKPKIFGYITGDEQKAYRDHELLPE